MYIYDNISLNSS